MIRLVIELKDGGISYTLKGEDTASPSDLMVFIAMMDTIKVRLQMDYILPETNEKERP